MEEAIRNDPTQKHGWESVVATQMAKTYMEKDRQENEASAMMPLKQKTHNKINATNNLFV